MSEPEAEDEGSDDDVGVGLAARVRALEEDREGLRMRVLSAGECLESCIGIGVEIGVGIMFFELFESWIGVLGSELEIGSGFGLVYRAVPRLRQGGAEDACKKHRGTLSVATSGVLVVSGSGCSA